MTIAIKVELTEDWGQNAPAVRVMARTFRHGTHELARLTPQYPIATVCITKDQDIYFEAEPYAVDVIEGRSSRPTKGNV